MKRAKAFMLTALLIFMAGAGFAQNNSALVGKWVGGPNNQELEFKASNFWNYNNEGGGAYSFDGTTLTLNYAGLTGTARVTVSGNTLTIAQFSDSIGRYLQGELIGTFRKAGAQSAQDPESGQSWPSSAQLAEYGISGLSQPSGATNVRWRLQPDMYSYPVIVISFNGTATEDTAIKNHFRSWNVRYDDSTRTRTDIGYERSGTRVGYTYNGREVMIIAGISD